MPKRTIADSGVEYFLINFDEDGIERREPNAPPLSATVRDMLADPASAITNVFFASHGWKGDIPAAIDQYDRWMGEMGRSADRAALVARRPAFKALNIGIHWPSLPFGDENTLTDRGTLSDDDAAVEPDIDAQVDSFVSTIGDTPAVRQAVRQILLAADDDDGTTTELPQHVRDAYAEVFAAPAFAGVDSSSTQDTADLGAAPGSDHPPFDADAMYQNALNDRTLDAAPDGGLLGASSLFDKLRSVLVSPLQQGSFWIMKNRARRVGETGVHRLLIDLMNAVPAGTRFHLMGHSFGCIVVSAAVAGPPDGTPIPRPVDTLFLAQGALSLWSFSPDIPYEPGTAGYFNRILSQGLVRGPIITTRSSFDYAVRRCYMPAAFVGRQLVLEADEPHYPKFGGVGRFGVQGVGAAAIDDELGDVRYVYDFLPGRIYNLDASGVIANTNHDPFSGAHSDIAHPEVAHAFWQGVAATE